jgi:hypothetical protein
MFDRNILMCIGNYLKNEDFLNLLKAYPRLISDAILDKRVCCINQHQLKSVQFKIKINNDDISYIEYFIRQVKKSFKNSALIKIYDPLESNYNNLLIILIVTDITLFMSEFVKFIVNKRVIKNNLLNMRLTLLFSANESINSNKMNLFKIINDDKIFTFPIINRRLLLHPYHVDKCKCTIICTK